MKKLLMTLMLGVMVTTMHAVSLFPYFCSVSGEFKEGAVDALQPLQIQCMYSNQSEKYNYVKDASDFIDGMVNLSSDEIKKKDGNVDGINVAVYASPIDNDKTSVILMLELPGKGLYITYDEVNDGPFHLGTGTPSYFE